ncbi:MAG: hypothetical protein MZV65_00105 [Chromatiales bacterium]|nr:hypothetical protein [Chromatiales bacterium]
MPVEKNADAAGRGHRRWPTAPTWPTPRRWSPTARARASWSPPATAPRSGASRELIAGGRRAWRRR